MFQARIGQPPVAALAVFVGKCEMYVSEISSENVCLYKVCFLLTEEMFGFLESELAPGKQMGSR